MNMLRFIGITLAGVGIGAVMGTLGKCASGTCPFTANPWRGALFGLIIGLLFALTLSLRQGGKAAVVDNLPHVKDKDGFRAAVLDVKGLVLVDFYADWCGPCRRLAPGLAEIAREKAGAVSVVKVKVGAAQALAQEYGVSSIPHLILFRDGVQVGSRIGYQSKASLEKWLAEFPAPALAAPVAASAADTPAPAKADEKTEER